MFVNTSSESEVMARLLGKTHLMGPQKYEKRFCISKFKKTNKQTKIIS